MVLSSIDYDKLWCSASVLLVSLLNHYKTPDSTAVHHYALVLDLRNGINDLLGWGLYLCSWGQMCSILLSLYTLHLMHPPG